MVAYYNLKETIKIASRSTKKRHLKLWLITHILVRKKYRGFGYLVNSYLRWVDDIIDNPQIGITEKEKFLQRQFLLIDAFGNYEKPEVKEFEENFLFHIIKYAKETKRDNYINNIKINMDAFVLDIHRLRNGGNFTRQELDEYLELLLTPVFFFTLCFVAPNFNSRISKKCVGKFFYSVLSLRDFIEDLDAGYINICKEDVIKYNINLKEIRTDPNVTIWARESYSKIMFKLNEELKILGDMPLLVKLTWFPGFIDQYKDLLRIKHNNFEIGRELRKEVLSEIQIAFSTIIKGFAMIKKVFL